MRIIIVDNYDYDLWILTVDNGDYDKEVERKPRENEIDYN